MAEENKEVTLAVISVKLDNMASELSDLTLTVKTEFAQQREEIKAVEHDLSDIRQEFTEFKAQQTVKV